MAAVAFTEEQKVEKEVKKLRKCIRGEMSEQKITQKKLAERLKITQQAFSYNLEHMSFSPYELFMICRFLGITISYEAGE